MGKYDLGRSGRLAKFILQVVDFGGPSAYLRYMEPVRRVSRTVSRVRAVLTDGSDAEDDPIGARWGFWRRAAALVGRYPLVADTTVAVVVALIAAVWLLNRSGSGPAEWALQAALIVPLVWRRRYPVAVFLLISVVALAQWALGTELVGDLALLVSLYTVASHRPRIVALGAAIVVEVGAVMASLRWRLGGDWFRSLVFLSGLAAAAVLLGTNLRARRARLAALTERAERLERERDQQSLIAAAAERTRIAREMHDVIAHSLAVIISLADGAAAKLHRDPERAAAAICYVADTGRQALGDTRRLLGVLHRDGSSGGLGPQPGVAQIDGLLEQVRATGLDAALSIRGQQRPLPAGTELATYRIVQEATTNALKHAVGATTLAVALEYDADDLRISVTDDGQAPGPAGLGHAGHLVGGHGLAGMRERAALYDGSVVAEPSATGWAVRATLRVPREAGTSTGSPPAAPLAEAAPNGSAR